MKWMLVAGALAIAGTAAAQDMQTPPAPPATDAPAPAPMPEPAPPPAPMPEPAPAAAPMAPATAPAADAADPVGGYQPSAPPLSGAATPGQPVQVQPSMSPAQAFPPPPPLESYPICKRGQYDNCRQRGG